MKKIFVSFLAGLAAAGFILYILIKSIFLIVMTDWSPWECTQNALYITLLLTYIASGIILPRIFSGKLRICSAQYCRCLDERIAIRKVAGDKEVFYQCPRCGQTYATHYGDNL